MLNVEDLVRGIAGLTVADFCHLQNQLVKRLGLVIRPSKPYAPPVVDTKPTPAPTKLYRVVMTGYRCESRIRAISNVRNIVQELFGRDAIGLQGAKELVDSVDLGSHHAVKSYLTFEKANRLYQRLQEGGVICDIREQGRL